MVEPAASERCADCGASVEATASCCSRCNKIVGSDHLSVRRSSPTVPVPPSHKPRAATDAHFNHKLPNDAYRRFFCDDGRELHLVRRRPEQQIEWGSLTVRDAEGPSVALGAQIVSSEWWNKPIPDAAGWYGCRHELKFADGSLVAGWNAWHAQERPFSTRLARIPTGLRRLALGTFLTFVVLITMAGCIALMEDRDGPVRCSLKDGLLIDYWECFDIDGNYRGTP